MRRFWPLLSLLALASCQAPPQGDPNPPAGGAKPAPVPGQNTTGAEAATPGGSTAGPATSPPVGGEAKPDAPVSPKGGG